MGSITLRKVVTKCVGVITGGLHCPGTFFCFQLPNSLSDSAIILIEGTDALPTYETTTSSNSNEPGLPTYHEARLEGK